MESGSCPIGGVGGSHELRFVSVEPSSGPDVPSPSLLVTPRLDARGGKSGTTTEALVTLPFGDPIKLDDGSSFNLVVLGGNLVVRGTGAADGITEEWTEIRIPLGGSGGLEGTFEAVGTRTGPGVTAGTQLTAKGTVKNDVTDPVLAASWSSPHGPPTGAFPWNAISLRASEPIAGAQLLSAIDATTTSNALPQKLNVGLDPVDQSAAWAGASRARLYLANWDLPSDALSLVTGGGINDPSGHAAKPYAVTLPYTGVAVSDALDLADGAAVSTWGSVAWLPAGSACDVGGCAKLGPFEASGCPAQRIGIAGRIASVGKKTLVVRYRTHAAAAAPGPSVLAVDVFGHDGSLTTTKAPGSTYAPQDPPLDGLPFASAWSTLTAPLPPGDDAAFELYVNGCTGASTATKTIVVVDGVDAN